MRCSVNKWEENKFAQTFQKGSWKDLRKTVTSDDDISVFQYDIKNAEA
jgi:hypothetical protein